MPTTNDGDAGALELPGTDMFWRSKCWWLTELLLALMLVLLLMSLELLLLDLNLSPELLPVLMFDCTFSWNENSLMSKLDFALCGSVIKDGFTDYLLLMLLSPLVWFCPKVSMLSYTGWPKPAVLLVIRELLTSLDWCIKALRATGLAGWKFLW